MSSYSNESDFCFHKSSPPKVITIAHLFISKCAHYYIFSFCSGAQMKTLFAPEVPIASFESPATKATPQSTPSSTPFGISFLDVHAAVPAIANPSLSDSAATPFDTLAFGKDTCPTPAFNTPSLDETPPGNFLKDL